MELFNLIGYGSLPLVQNRQKIKERLLASLLAPYSQGKAPAVEVFSDSYGAPHVCLDQPGDCFVSFSYCKDRLWAVLAVGVSVGIDVETPVNFPDFYPVSKVFTPGETTIMDGFFCNRNSGFAALWSCKEAVVKARRTGFWDIVPRDVEIIAMSRHCDYHHVEIRAGQTTYFAILKKKGSLWCAIAYPVLPTIKPV